VRTCEITNRLTELITERRARTLNATVSQEADRWYVSFGCEVERDLLSSNDHADTVGVDLGVLSLVTLSDGIVVPGPRALRVGLRKLRRLDRCRSRCRRGSKNRIKATRKLARQHAWIAHVRRDHLHKLTTVLAKNHGRVVIEDLNVSGMLSNRRLARGIADASFGEFRRMLEYKCRWYGAELAVADRFFPSSKTCSRCGVVKLTLSLGERTFACTACGLSIDRDLNAAINLAGWKQPAVAVSAPETENACPRGGKTGPSPARLVDAGTGNGPEFGRRPRAVCT
jgi:putative transposase